MKLYYRFLLYPLAVLLLLMQSCIGEDNSDCASGKVKVYFTYRTTYGPWLIDPTEISSINLLIFDENGTFVGEWTDRNPAMSSSYYMEVPLSYGSYRFVCWAGMEDSYTVTPDPLVKRQTLMNNCILSLNRSSQNTVTVTPHHLFHALLKEGVVDKPECSFTLEIKKLTNTINVTSEGLTSTADEYRLTIDDNNGDYNFEASPASTANEKLQYLSTCRKDEKGQPYTSLRVMTLDENRPNPVLTLTNTTQNETAFTANLVELILKLRERAVTVDFDNIHTYNIHLLFDTYMGVKVTINGWELNAAQTEI